VCIGFGNNFNDYYYYSYCCSISRIEKTPLLSNVWLSPSQSLLRLTNPCGPASARGISESPISKDGNGCDKTEKQSKISIKITAINKDKTIELISVLPTQKGYPFY
jgi:hypothetical protein